MCIVKRPAVAGNIRRLMSPLYYDLLLLKAPKHHEQF